MQENTVLKTQDYYLWEHKEVELEGRVAQFQSIVL